MYLQLERAGTTYKFFQDSIEIDAAYLYDIILRNYNDIDFVLELDYIDSIELLNKLRDDEIEKEFWDRWISLYPHMVLGKLKLVEFKEFKDLVLKRGSYTRLTKEEIYEDVDNIINEFNNLEKGGE